MRILAGTVLCIALTACAQRPHLPAAQKTAEGADQQSRLLEFIKARNVFFTRTFFNAGEIDSEYSQSVSVSGLLIRHPLTSDDSASGIQITVNSHDRFSDAIYKTVDHEAYVDADEIKNLQDALDYMNGKAQLWVASPPAQYTEMTFRSRGDFQCGLFYMEKQGPLFYVQASPDERDILSLPWQKISMFKSMVMSAANAASATSK
jgi:hypothetical protein